MGTPGGITVWPFSGNQTPANADSYLPQSAILPRFRDSPGGSSPPPRASFLLNGTRSPQQVGDWYRMGFRLPGAAILGDGSPQPICLD